MAVGAGSPRGGQSWAILLPNVALTSRVGCSQTASSCLHSTDFSQKSTVGDYPPLGASGMGGVMGGTGKNLALGGEAWDTFLVWVNLLCDPGCVQPLRPQFLSDITINRL